MVNEKIFLKLNEAQQQMETGEWPFSFAFLWKSRKNKINPVCPTRTFLEVCQGAAEGKRKLEEKY